MTTGRWRREVGEKTRTIADELREEGRREAEARTLQQILVRQLRLRFGRLPRPIEQVIRNTNEIARLDAWLDRVVTVKTLDEIGILSR